MFASAATSACNLSLKPAVGVTHPLGEFGTQKGATVPRSVVGFRKHLVKIVTFPSGATTERTKCVNK